MGNETVSPIVFFIMMVMGYGIGFSYLHIAIAKREIKYLRTDNASSLKFLEQRLERDLKRVENENQELRRELRRLENRTEK